MHEVGIAQNLIEQVEQRLALVTEPIQVLKISVSLGRLSGVSAEALQFGFQVAKRGSKISFAELEIKEIPLRLKCPVCLHQFENQSLVVGCPACGQGPVEIVSGKGLSLDSLEYE